MSPLLGLRTAIYKIPSEKLQEAKDWYSSILETKPYFDEPYYIGYEIGGFELGLQPEDIAPEAKVPNINVMWGVADIESEFTRFVRAGATPLEKPMSVGGDILVATVRDPWGNDFGLIYNPGFKGFTPAE